MLCNIWKLFFSSLSEVSLMQANNSQIFSGSGFQHVLSISSISFLRFPLSFQQVV